MFLSTLLCLLLGIALPATAEPEPLAPVTPMAADEVVAAGSAEVISEDLAPIPTLPPLLVTEKADDPLSGMSSFGREGIRTIPLPSSNITDLAPLLPGVQASDDSNRSTTGGEILPALISISGGKVNQNNVLVDGVGNGNQIDPLASNPEDPRNIPGHPLTLFPFSRLVEEINIYDHSIPARYGNFTGGVVEVSTREPKKALGAGFNLRTTRSDWTWFQVPAEKEEAFTSSTSYKAQPEFTKYDAGIDLDLPTGKDAGLLTAYQRTWSNHSLSFLGGRKSQSRLLENYLAKWSKDLGPREKIDLSLMATPYVASYFLKDTKDSDYDIRTRSVSTKATWTTVLNEADMEFVAAFSSTELSRHSPQNYWLWKNTPSKNWGVGTNSPEGGFGSLERHQETFQVQAHLTSSPLSIGWLRQTLGGGVELGWTSGSSQRQETTRSYSNATVVTGTLDCGNDPACVSNEQYFKSITIYDPYRVEADRSELGAYLEDRLTLGPLALRPGLRFDYDTFSKNQNLSPRLSGSYDLLGTLFLFGANRYYGTLSFTDVLREGEAPQRTLSRNSFSVAWTERVATTSTRHADLKNPYVDEVSAGLEQPIPGGRLTFDYVHRKGKDEVSRQLDQVVIGTTTYNNYRFNNNGRSRYESFRLGGEGTWGNTTLLSANVSHEEANTSVESYDDFLDGKTLDRLIYFNGRLIHREELPRLDYNRTWIGNLTCTQRLPLRFEFSNVTRYRGPYRALKVVQPNQVIDGQLVDVYAEVKSPAGWTFDWKLSWRQPIGMAELLLNLEVLNVFNHSNRVGGETGLYEQGRQIWAGVEGRF